MVFMPGQGFIQKPTAKRGRNKYNTEGFTKKEIFLDLNINEEFAEMLANSANLGLAENSKSNYRTAARHIKRCEEFTGMDMSLPFTIEKTLNYVGYLLSERGVSHGTVDQYLSGVRMLHLCQNLDISSLRPPIVALILKGRQHWENIQNTINKKPKRVAVTLSIMKFLKRK